jgi:hypothetical protein
MDPRFVLSLGCMAVGAVLAIGSLYLLLKQRPVVDQSGNVTEIDIPLFGKLKTNYPSLGALFIAAFLVWFPLHILPAPPAVNRIPVSGKITLQGKPPSGGVMVGIVPGNLAPLRNDGSYDIEVLDGEHTYTGVAYYNGDTSKDVYLGGVSVQNGKGTFNAVLGRQP